MNSHPTRRHLAVILGALAASEVAALLGTFPHVWELPRVVATFARFDGGEEEFFNGVQVLAMNGALTLGRALLGLVLGITAGLAGGMVPLLMPGWQAVPTRMTSMLRAIPPLSLVFIWMYASAGPNIGAIGYIASCLGLLVAGTLQATHAYLPEALLHQVTFLGGGRVRQIIDVALPSMWFRARETVAWSADLLLPLSLGAEFVDSQARGLGGLVYHAFRYANFSQLFVLALVYLVLGRLVIFAVRRLMRTGALSHHHFSAQISP